MSIAIELADLRSVRVLPAEEEGALPIENLRSDGCHLHGELRIVVAGQALPRLGFFGPADVCIGTWVHELVTAVSAMRAEDPARYLFDECEQGQPAFLFERTGETVSVSVVDSEQGDGVGNPEWGTQTCTLFEFSSAVQRFVGELGSVLEEAAPGHGLAWVEAATNGPV